MVALNGAFLLVVMIHDWQSAFFLKAKIFNRRMTRMMK
eukprot:CAMPEP_0116874282 /NCGR_PEP_ID=MMETSP0463-20121206/5711_1 /TAXON_ID=181622 /ORGANISM="Strombidinopsis sp, Strain SopsisLIS2011" /LENGTH=37 /DNA_ID= /DNA_START= /DNA_END= /DNA_ORIENTATION=